MKIDYVDHGSVLSSSTSSAETDKRLLIAKAIWDEKANIATLGASQDDYSLGWEEVEQIIRQADAILTNSSQQPFQPTPTAQPFSHDNVNGSIERPDENESSQFPFPDIQAPPQLMPESSPHEITSTHLPNSHCQGHTLAVADTGTEFPLVQELPTQQELATGQEAPTQEATPAQDLNPATTMASPESRPLNGWLIDYPLCDDEEFHEMCYGSKGPA